MTRTHAEVGDRLDAEPGQVVNFEVRTELRKVVLERLERAEREGDTRLARELKWELGMFDFPRPRPGATEYLGPADPRFAEHYGLDDAVDTYARDRASETTNPALRARYADFVLLRMEPKGRAWVEQSRLAARAYREYVDHALDHMTGEEREFAGLYIARAIQQVARIIGPRGGSCRVKSRPSGLAGCSASPARFVTSNGRRIEPRCSTAGPTRSWSTSSS